MRVSKKERFLHTLVLHNKSLTRRDLLGHLDFLEGALDFGSGILRTLVGLGKFRLSSLRITLQGLVLFDGILELLLDLADPGLLLLARGAFLSCFVLGLGQRLLEGRYFGCGP